MWVIKINNTARARCSANLRVNNEDLVVKGIRLEHIHPAARDVDALWCCQRATLSACRPTLLARRQPGPLELIWRDKYYISEAGTYITLAFIPLRLLGNHKKRSLSLCALRAIKMLSCLSFRGTQSHRCKNTPAGQEVELAGQESTHLARIFWTKWTPFWAPAQRRPTLYFALKGSWWKLDCEWQRFGRFSRLAGCANYIPYLVATSCKQILFELIGMKIMLYKPI